jgi:selenophosphate synthetase-related protein
MLAECSGVGVKIDVRAVPKPDSAPIDRWLMTFPSFGYLLAVAPVDVAAVTQLFAERDIAASDIGGVRKGSEVVIADGEATEVIWDFERMPLIGARRHETIA